MLNEYLTDSVLLPAKIYDANYNHVPYSEFFKIKIIHFYGGQQKPWYNQEKHLACLLWYRDFYFTYKKIKELK